jgi:hypothetical protein
MRGLPWANECFVEAMFGNYKHRKAQLRVTADACLTQRILRLTHKIAQREDSALHFNEEKKVFYSRGP